ncbi:MAG: phytanoyl-CoA dioxygenase family protein [Rhodobacteraceae bacterium]|nr:phytanoyl-CoA dioxygenase family protein [Paracoccaceae bacterium]
MSVKAVLSYPLGVLKLATGAKSFDGNPVLASPALNRRGLHVRRVRLAEQMADWRRRRIAHLVSEEHAAAFGRDGFVEVRDFLPKDLFERVRNEAMGHVAQCREMRQGPAVTRRVTLDPADRAALPHSVAATEDPRFQGLVRYVASHDARPFCYIQTIIAEEPVGSDDPQTHLHFDTFHPICKAWLFLHDVGEEDGPFAYVPGSHRLTEQRAEWEQAQAMKIAEHPDKYHRRGSFRLTPGDLSAMDLPPPRKMAVPGNTLIAADTHGAHGRSASPKPTVRVEIYATLRRGPFTPFAKLDALGLPGVRHKPAQRLYDAMDFAEKRLGKGNAWRPVSPRRMDSPAAD